ncbi:hypothetical protein BRYFOR_07952 [Marvinbryantia formatexigens DSM 14469]|uniref:Uncharacterized protein n=1 Tax=Marvinbryantia formatexigens DSM 14469 TaxID=478749 RepID=C6LH42_9FIRM|nr:hypothetical protein BRYFOR_07952 [Marvinbryantia formatexigens DSM 14469]
MPPDWEKRSKKNKKQDCTKKNTIFLKNSLHMVKISYIMQML